MKQKLEKIRALIVKDIAWKALAVCLAILLWFVIINMTNPVQTAPATLRLELRGTQALEGERKMVVGEGVLRDTIVQVEVRCKAKDAPNIAAKLDAYVDFSLFEMMSARQTGQPLPTAITVAKKNEGDDFEIIGYSPKAVSVTIDRKETVTKAVSASFGATAVADGYLQTAFEAYPPTVTITGAKTQIDKITAVGINVDLTGRTETFEQPGKIHAFDADGKDLMLDMSDTSGRIVVAVSKLGSIPIARPTYTGEPAPGYAVASVTYDLRELEVMGDEDSLAQTTQLRLPPVNIAGATATVRHTYDLRGEIAGTKLNVVNGKEYECEVTVVIERLAEKTFLIPIADVTKTGYTAGAHILTEEVFAHVAATRADMDKLTSLKASIDLSNLEPGMNEVPVVFTKVNGVTILEQTETVQVQVGGGEQLEPTESPAPFMP